MKAHLFCRCFIRFERLGYRCPALAELVKSGADDLNGLLSRVRPVFLAADAIGYQIQRAVFQRRPGITDPKSVLVG